MAVHRLDVGSIEAEEGEMARFDMASLFTIVQG
jgi:hypothetical protein